MSRGTLWALPINEECLVVGAINLAEGPQDEREDDEKKEPDVSLIPAPTVPQTNAPRPDRLSPPGKTPRTLHEEEDQLH